MVIYNKLVRDKIPEIIRQNDQVCQFTYLDQSAYITELKKKLAEELNEYLEAENNEGAIEELADILEIIYTLSAIHGEEFKGVEEARQKKSKERGGFHHKVYLLGAEERK